jgi:glutamate N-acetyltransferase/amino-acid N-acetyltransferase
VESYSSEADYLQALAGRSVLPEGFRCAVKPLTFRPRERATAGELPMNVSLILLDRETRDFGGVFTRNRFPGAPVIIGRRRLDERAVRGVLINTKISNVCAAGGEGDANALLARLAGLVGARPEEFFAASTGIIGWRLPVKEMADALPGLAASVDATSLLALAKGIMTTDAFPKVRSATAGRGRIVGVAKGAGMIEPNMATLLCFLLTDVAVPREELRGHLAWCVERSLNRLSVDSDQSTSDMTLAFSSGMKGPADPGEFREALLSVLNGLALDIARNAEGAGHVVRVRVEKAPDEQTGLGIARAVVNSPLVKTAMFGNDPNVGRIVSAIGDYLGNAGLPVDGGRMLVRMGGEEIFGGGSFRLDSGKEERLSTYLRNRVIGPGRVRWPQHDRTVDVDIVMEGTAPAVQVLGTDLSYDYVKENADYRS